MIGDPVVLAAPSVLHREGNYLVWLTGVTLSPVGVVELGVEVNSVAEREFYEDPAWSFRDGRSPIESAIELPGAPITTLPHGSYGPDRSTFRHRQWFLPVDPKRFAANQIAAVPLAREQLAGALGRVEIHPLDLHFTIDLDPQ